MAVIFFQRHIGGFVAALTGVAIMTAPETAAAQNSIGQGPVADQFDELCASCHIAGANGGSLFDGEWQYGSSPEEIARNTKYGIPAVGMPAFEDLSDEDVRSLVIYMTEQASLAEGGGSPATSLPAAGVYEAGGERFAVEELAEFDGIIWTAEPIPGMAGEMLVAMRNGRLYHLSADGSRETITGLPEITPVGQGGLLDIAFHPDYAENGWVYLAYTEKGREEDDKPAVLTAIVRSRIDNGELVDTEQIFSADPSLHSTAGYHFGTRIAFDGNGYLYFSIGDRGAGDLAQDLSRPNGKIHRLYDDGRVPEDNPFADDPDAFPTVWSYGHRNPQGLAFDPTTGLLVELEHGPRGGDEFNVIKPGLNYGWNEVTYGMNYSGTPITAQTEREDVEPPITYWVPSLAVSTIEGYAGDLFPAWKGKLLIGGLASQELRMLTFDGQKVTEQEILLKQRGRVRDLHVADDGTVYLATTAAGRGGQTSYVLHLVPAP